MLRTYRFPRRHLEVILAVLIAGCSVSAGQPTTSFHPGSNESTTATDSPDPTVSTTTLNETTSSSSLPGESVVQFGGELPEPDGESITLEQVMSVHPGYLRHQVDDKGPGDVQYDEAGIAVISPAAWQDVDQSTPLHHPTVITRVANGAYARVLANPDDDESRDIHIRHARWLRDNLVWNEQGVANWVFPMALDEYELEAGWYSAMTNGFGLAVMFQAATLVEPLEGETFVEAANGVLKSFASHVDEGGVARPLLDGSVCFEEVVDPKEPHCILNGHHFALGGIQVASEIGSRQASELLQAGIDFSFNHLENYDVGFASLYSLDGKYAEPGGYNKIHVNQMLWLYYLTGEQSFMDKAIRWSNFESDPLVSVVASDSLDPDKHGADTLIDEATWWGYWSSRTDPVELEFSFGSSRTVCGVAVFAFAENEMPFSAATLTMNEAVISLDPDVPIGTNLNNSGPTSATSYDLEECIVADSAVLRLSPDSGEVLALREVDFFFDRSAEVSDLLTRLIAVYEYGRPGN